MIFFIYITAIAEIYTLSLHDGSSDLLASGMPSFDRVQGTLLRKRRSRPLGELRRGPRRSEEHTSELQSRRELVCRLLLEKKNKYSQLLKDISYDKLYLTPPIRPPA